MKLVSCVLGLLIASAIPQESAATWFEVVLFAPDYCPEVPAGDTPESLMRKRFQASKVRSSTTKLPDRGNQMEVFVEGRRAPFLFTSMHGSCMVTTAIGEEKVNGKGGSTTMASFKAEMDAVQRRSQAASDSRRAIGLGAKLPASTLRLLDAQQCGIEEVATAKPQARGGAEVKANGGGTMLVCWWQDDANVYVTPAIGPTRTVAMKLVYPIKE